MKVQAGNCGTIYKNSNRSYIREVCSRASDHAEARERNRNERKRRRKPKPRTIKRESGPVAGAGKDRDDNGRNQIRSHCGLNLSIGSAIRQINTKTVVHGGIRPAIPDDDPGSCIGSGKIQIEVSSTNVNRVIAVSCLPVNRNISSEAYGFAGSGEGAVSRYGRVRSPKSNRREVDGSVEGIDHDRRSLKRRADQSDQTDASITN